MDGYIHGYGEEYHPNKLPKYKGYYKYGKHSGHGQLSTANGDMIYDGKILCIFKMIIKVITKKVKDTEWVKNTFLGLLQLCTKCLQF